MTIVSRKTFEKLAGITSKVFGEIIGDVSSFRDQKMMEKQAQRSEEDELRKKLRRLKEKHAYVLEQIAGI